MNANVTLEAVEATKSVKELSNLLGGDEVILRIVKAALKQRVAQARYHKTYSMKRAETIERAQAILAEAEKRGIKIS